MNTNNRIAEIKKRLKQGKYYVPYAPDDIEYLLSELSKTRLERNQLEANKNYYKEQLAKAEADGRLVMLPCKVGDILELRVMGTVQKYRFMGIIQQEGYLPSLYGRQLFGKFQDVPIAMVESFGKTVFLTREAAEKALSPICNTTKLPCAGCNPVCEHRGGAEDGK